MKFATFNVKNLYPEKEATPEMVQLYDEKISWTAERIKNINADYIALQEVGSEAGLSEAVKRSGIPYKIFSATPSKRGIANALLYKDSGLSCESWAPEKLNLPVFRVGDTDRLGGGLAVNRAFVYARGILFGQDLHIFNVHLKSGFPVGLKEGEKEMPINTHLESAEGTARSMMHRLAESIVLRKKIDEIISSNEDAQIVVLGDFNDLEPAIACVQGSWDLPVPGRLDRVTNLLETADRYSFLSENNSRKHLDHILVTRNLYDRLESVMIYNKELRNHVDLGIIMKPTVDSDHAPVTAVFRD